MPSRRVKFLAFSGVIALALLTRIVCFVGLIGSDDLTYNQRAYAIVTGTFAPQADHQAARIGLFLPVAAAFRLFGVNEISSVLFPFLCAMTTTGLVLWMGIACLGWRPGLMAGSLYAFLPIEMFQASILLPDLPSATCVAVSAALIFRASAGRTRPQAAMRMALAGIFFGWAYLIKETAIFFGVFVGLYALQQWRQQRQLPRVWLWFAAGSALPVGLELGYYAWTTGMPWFRYVAVQSGHNTSIFSGHRYQGWNLVRRLTIDPVAMLFQVADFGLVYVVALAGSVYGVWQRQAGIRFLAGWLGCLAVLYNFASTSLSGYAPLLLFERFFLALSVPAVLICAWFVEEVAHILATPGHQDSGRVRLALGLPLMLLIVVALLRFSWLTLAALGVVAALLALTFCAPARQWLHHAPGGVEGRMLVLAAVLLIMLLPGIVSAVRGERLRRGLTCERDIPRLLEAPLRHPVYTDERTAAILEFLYQYRHNDLIVGFHERDPITAEHAYVIANWERLFFSNALYRTPIPDILFDPPAYWRGPALLGGPVNPCLIYHVPDIP